MGQNLRAMSPDDKWITDSATGEVIGVQTAGQLQRLFGQRMKATDVSANQAPYILAQAAVPVILPSSGSSNATGVITMTTALSYSLASGQSCAIYLPAGVVTAGSQGSGAGVYQATGLGTNNTVQISGTGIVTANGAYTQTTGADLTLVTIPVPGGTMGANGVARVSVYWSHANSANTKTEKVLLGTALISTTGTTTANRMDIYAFRNRGLQASQILQVAGVASGTATPGVATVDTSANQNFTFAGQLANAADYIILEGYTVEILPGA